MILHTYKTHGLILKILSWVGGKCMVIFHSFLSLNTTTLCFCRLQGLTQMSGPFGMSLKLCITKFISQKNPVFADYRDKLNRHFEFDYHFLSNVCVSWSPVAVAPSHVLGRWDRSHDSCVVVKSICNWLWRLMRSVEQ